MAETIFLSGNEVLGSTSLLPGSGGTAHYCCVICGREFLTEFRTADSHRWYHSYCLDHQLRAHPTWPWLLFESGWGNRPHWYWPVDITPELPAPLLRLIVLAEFNHLDYLES